MREEGSCPGHHREECAEDSRTGRPVREDVARCAGGEPGTAAAPPQPGGGVGARAPAAPKPLPRPSLGWVPPAHSAASPSFGSELWAQHPQAFPPPTPLPLFPFSPLKRLGARRQENGTKTRLLVDFHSLPLKN